MSTATTIRFKPFVAPKPYVPAKEVKTNTNPIPERVRYLEFPADQSNAAFQCLNSAWADQMALCLNRDQEPQFIDVVLATIGKKYGHTRAGRYVLALLEARKKRVLTELKNPSPVVDAGDAEYATEEDSEREEENGYDY